MSKTTKVQAPDAKTVLREANAREALTPLRPGGSIITLTYGQFSLGDLIRALLDRSGPADITLSTWTAAKAEIEHAWSMLDDGRIITMRWLVDRSFATRQPAYCAALVDRFGPDAIRTTRTHAKWATIVSETHHFAIRTSCNLNSNPRLELIEVSDSPELCGWFNDLADDFWRELPAEDMSCELPDAARCDDAVNPISMGATVRVGP